MTDISDLKLRFLGSLVEQLGAQMYPSATATIAELISNAWDADAQHVWVTIPLGQKWSGDDEIVVVDDGHGMTHPEVRDAYLHVGRKRRVAGQTDTSPGGRPLHGRKGIGKLAAFGTARTLDFLSVSQRDRQSTRFRMDYETIRQLAPTDDYQVGATTDTTPLTSPNGGHLDHGTRICLSGLRLKRALNPDQFRTSMARRFAILSTKMEIVINGIPLERFDVPVQFRFPPHAVPPGVVTTEDGWAIEQVAGQRVKWWVGFTEKPLSDESALGISVLARGKMVQRPFLFQRAHGATGQLGQQYLVGEVQADWLDDGRDIEDDHIQANRDQLQLENEDLDDFVAWGRDLITWALSTRNTLRQKQTENKLREMPGLDAILDQFTRDEQPAILKIAAQAARIDEVTPTDVLEILRAVVAAKDDVVIRQMWQDINEESDDLQPQIWSIIHRFGLIDARRNLTLIQARLDAIDRLRQFVHEGAREVPTIHNHIKRYPWLIDPRWHMLDDEVDLEQLGIPYERESDPESGRYLDFLFALQSSKPSLSDDYVVVEIKRGTDRDKSVHSATEEEVNRFNGYVVKVADRLSRSTDPPRVTGLMIAQRYTPDADLIRKDHESRRDRRVSFQTWDRVLRDTERLHRGWLMVEERRADRSSLSEGNSSHDANDGEAE